MFAGGETLWYQCQNVRETLRHWCRTVGTFRHQSDGAEMSWVRSIYRHWM